MARGAVERRLETRRCLEMVETTRSVEMAEDGGVERRDTTGWRV